MSERRDGQTTLAVFETLKKRRKGIRQPGDGGGPARR
jgi:hypothetical protein